MAKHTPGPWKLGKGSGVIINCAKESKKICEVGYSKCTKDEVDLTNACLIAKSPTMYEALKTIINLPDSIACPSIKNLAREAMKGKE